MNRRMFLEGLGLTAGALAFGSLLPRMAKAAETDDRYYVFAYFEGGWDHLLALDPRDPQIFTANNAIETGIDPGYERLAAPYSSGPVNAGPYWLGPAAAALAPHADTFSVVRGVNMATLTHEVGRRYFITGRAPSGLQARGPSIGSLAVSQLGDDRPIPHVASQMETYNEGLPPFAAALPVNFVNQLQYTLQENFGLGDGGMPASVKAALAAYREQPRDTSVGAGAGATPMASIYLENQERATELVASGLHQQFNFNAPALAGIREHYGLVQGQYDTPAGRAALASQALKTGLSRVVSVALAQGLDTHDNSWAFNHPAFLDQGFSALARLVEDLADSEAPTGGSLLSKTTIVAFSEFGRTPRINSRGGRDHHLGNCALIGGAGIQGGQVIGGSSDFALEPEYVNLTTGAVDPNGEVLKPEHVLATALQAGGLDPSELRVGGIASLLA